jgi:hypothetical protein
MLASALILAAFATGTVLALWRRRTRKTRALAPALGALPAGLKHLATTVSDLSGSGLQLPSHGAIARKPRLGTLLHLQHH